MTSYFALSKGYYYYDGTCVKSGTVGFCIQKVLRIHFGELCYNGLHAYDGDALSDLYTSLPTR